MGVLQLTQFDWTLEVFVGQALVKEVKDASEALFDALNSIEAYLFYMNFQVYIQSEELVHPLNHLLFRGESILSTKLLSAVQSCKLTHLVGKLTVSELELLIRLLPRVSWSLPSRSSRTSDEFEHLFTIESL